MNKEIRILLSCDVICNEPKDESLRLINKAIESIECIQYQWLHNEAWQALNLLKSAKSKIEDDIKP